ncbi:MAG: FAD:protein FMN transferase [Rikenellaceae bacterium]|jgi:thiamine biosynthesis lipoprotein|nr:FAD:protein FMN transferase [Rikenellaceae bacterium]
MKRLLLIPIITLLAACGGRGGRDSAFVTTIDGFAQGTYYHIVMMSPDSLRGIERSIDSLFTVIDNSMSIFNSNSRLSHLNRGEIDQLDPYITYCINTAREVSAATGGLYDITVKPLTQAWGFATEEREAEPNVDSLLQFVGYDKIAIEGNRLVKADPRVQLDLNSIAKGYSADLVAELIESRGVKRYLVELGGEIVARGNNASGIPWVIGIDEPVEGNMVPGVQTQVMISLTDKCMATSGNYRNFRYDDKGRKIVHSINPRTGAASPGNVLSATVVAPTCGYADAMGTALMVLGFERAVELVEKTPDVWAYIIYTDEKNGYQTWISPELKKKIVE